MIIDSRLFREAACYSHTGCNWLPGVQPQRFARQIVHVGGCREIVLAVTVPSPNSLAHCDNANVDGCASSSSQYSDLMMVVMSQTLDNRCPLGVHGTTRRYTLLPPQQSLRTCGGLSLARVATATPLHAITLRWSLGAVYLLLTNPPGTHCPTKYLNEDLSINYYYTVVILISFFIEHRHHVELSEDEYCQHSDCM